MNIIDQSFIFHNCLTLRKQAEGVAVCRFSEAQLAVYAQDEALRLRSCCPSGSCLDFVTDATEVVISYQVGKACRNWLNFDLLIDGIMVGTAGGSVEIPGIQQVQFELGNGRKHVTLYLPHTVELLLSAVELPAGAMVAAAPRHQQNLLCLGDSITQGMDARHPAAIYPVLLARFLELNLLNQAVGGYHFHPDSLDETLDYRPDLITVAYGTNDWGHQFPMDAIERNCRAYLQRLTGIFPNVPVKLITPIWRQDHQEKRPAGTLSGVIALIAHVAAGFPQIQIVRGWELVPQLPEYFGDGRLHPNDEGFARLALGLVQRMR